MTAMLPGRIQTVIPFAHPQPVMTATPIDFCADRRPAMHPIPDSAGMIPPDPQPGAGPDLIRSHALIPAALNERLKAMARAQGRTADVVIGELVVKAAEDVERWEAEQEAARLRERFGERWLQVLQEVA